MRKAPSIVFVALLWLWSPAPTKGANAMISGNIPAGSDAVDIRAEFENSWNINEFVCAQAFNEATLKIIEAITGRGNQFLMLFEVPGGVTTTNLPFELTVDYPDNGQGNDFTVTLKIGDVTQEVTVAATYDFGEVKVTTAFKSGSRRKARKSVPALGQWNVVLVGAVLALGIVWLLRKQSH